MNALCFHFQVLSDELIKKKKKSTKTVELHYAGWLLCWYNAEVSLLYLILLDILLLSYMLLKINR